MPRIKLQSGKTTVLKDLRALAQQIQMESLNIWREAIVQKKLLDGIKDDSQIDARLLQKLQPSQQRIAKMTQLMTNISRTNHELAKNIIQNLRA